MLCGSQANLTMFMICWYVGPTQNEKWKYKERCSSLIRNLYPASPVPTHESATYRFVIHSIYRDLNEADIPVRCVSFFFLRLRFAFRQGHSTRRGKITSKNRRERKSNVSTSAWLLRTSGSSFGGGRLVIFPRTSYYQMMEFDFSASKIKTLGIAEAVLLRTAPDMYRLSSFWYILLRARFS